MSTNSSSPRPLKLVSGSGLTLSPTPAAQGGQNGSPINNNGSPINNQAPQINFYALLIQNARSPRTKRAYADNLRRYFREVYGADPKGDPDAGLVRAFLALSAPELAMALAQHRDAMTQAGLSAATINLRLAALRSLIDIANKYGFCAVDSKGLILSLKTEAYRDTRGPGMENMRKLLGLPDQATLIGRRDFALLRLLADNGLRRFEVCGADVSHFEPGGKRLSILGKRRDQREWVTLHATTRDAIAAYLQQAGHTDGALFRNCAFRGSAKGHALMEDGLDDIVRRYGKRVGLANLSCHKFRHFAITALLDATGGDMRRVQKFSRHKDINILAVYDDNRADHQGEMTQMLGDLLES